MQDTEDQAWLRLTLQKAFREVQHLALRLVVMALLEQEAAKFVQARLADYPLGLRT